MVTADNMSSEQRSPSASLALPLAKGSRSTSTSYDSSVSVESSESVSLISIISGADVRVIRDDEVILSHLILYLIDDWAWVSLGHLGQLSSLQELLIILFLEHGFELRSHGNAHLVDFTLKSCFQEK